MRRGAKRIIYFLLVICAVGGIAQNVPWVQQNVPWVRQNILHQDPNAAGAPALPCDPHPDQFYSKLAIYIDANEGQGGYTKLRWDDPIKGGVTVGKLLWSQKDGSLKTLLSAWFDADPQRFETYFGATATPESVESATLTKDSPAGAALQRALSDQVYAFTQDFLIRQLISTARQTAADNNHTSELFAAGVADLTAEAGPNAVSEALAAGKVSSISNENDAFMALESSVHRPTSDAYGAQRQARIAAAFAATTQVCGKG